MRIKKIAKKTGKLLLVKKIVVNLHSQFANESAEVDSVAQLVEQLTLNQWVEGSSPSGVTKSLLLKEAFFISPTPSHTKKINPNFITNITILNNFTSACNMVLD